MQVYHDLQIRARYHKLNSVDVDTWIFTLQVYPVVNFTSETEPKTNPAKCWLALPAVFNAVGLGMAAPTLVGRCGNRLHRLQKQQAHVSALTLCAAIQKHSRLRPFNCIDEIHADDEAYSG